MQYLGFNYHRYEGNVTQTNGFALQYKIRKCYKIVVEIIIKKLLKFGVTFIKKIRIYY